jgi:glyoxylase-like metal-dependent hydrolase (beta-lactamase superfamily II)
MAGAKIVQVDCRLEGPRLVKACIIVSENRSVLVDAGVSINDGRIILNKMKELGVKPKSVKLCVITHRHFDHTGGRDGAGLKLLKQTCDFKIAMHQLEAEDVETKTGLKADILLQGDQQLPEMPEVKVFHIPGHVPGNICLYHEPNRTIIAGDAIFSTGGWLIPPPPYLCEDPVQAKEGLRKLLNLKVDSVLVTHGEDVLKDGNLHLALIFAGNREEAGKVSPMFSGK